MGVYIKGIDMPQDGSWRTVRIHPDGSCFIPNWQGDCTLIKGAQAGPVPPHGRLIDADALIKTLGIGDLPIRLTYEIINAPTIIEAEEEDE